MLSVLVSLWACISSAFRMRHPSSHFLKLYLSGVLAIGQSVLDAVDLGSLGFFFHSLSSWFFSFPGLLLVHGQVEVNDNVIEAFLVGFFLFLRLELLQNHRVDVLLRFLGSLWTLDSGFTNFAVHLDLNFPVSAGLVLTVSFSARLFLRFDRPFILLFHRLRSMLETTD